MSEKINLVRRLVAAMKQSKGFDRIFDKLEVLSASDKKCVFAWKVEENLLNVGGTLHGGVIASVIDNTTTIALGSTSEGRRGVSMELSVSYMRAARPGDTLNIEAVCRKVGSTVAFTEASITNQEGKIIATGKHTKFLASHAEKMLNDGNQL